MGALSGQLLLPLLCTIRISYNPSSAALGGNIVSSGLRSAYPCSPQTPYIYWEFRLHKKTLGTGCLQHTHISRVCICCQGLPKDECCQIEGLACLPECAVASCYRWLLLKYLFSRKRQTNPPITEGSTFCHAVGPTEGGPDFHGLQGKIARQAPHLNGTLGSLKRKK